MPSSLASQTAMLFTRRINAKFTEENYHHAHKSSFFQAVRVYPVKMRWFVVLLLFYNRCNASMSRNVLIDPIDKSQNAPVPYPIMFHSKQKYAYFECSIVGCETGVFWGLWNWYIALQSLHKLCLRKVSRSAASWLLSYKRVLFLMTITP